MYKPKYIFVWRSCIRSTSLTPQSSITITEGFGSRLIPHTGWHEEHRFLSSVLISSLWHCCIFTQLWPSVSPWWEEWTQQLNSWEFEAWDIWIGNREHPSSLLPLCQPCARQWLGSKEDPIKPTFMRYVAFLSSDMEVFFFFETDKTFRKCTTCLCDPNLAVDTAAKCQQRAHRCCLCSLSHSLWIRFGFHCNILY